MMMEKEKYVGFQEGKLVWLRLFKFFGSMAIIWLKRSLPKPMFRNLTHEAALEKGSIF